MPQSNHPASEHLAIDFGIVIHAWGTLGMALRRLPRVFVSGALATALLTFGAWKLQGAYHGLLAGASEDLRLLFSFAYTVAIDILDCVVIAAVAVPVHRLVLLGERGDRIAPFFSGRTWRSALWLAGFEVLVFLTLLPLQALMSSSAIAAMAIVAGMIVYLAACFVVILRLSLIFPEISVDEAKPAGLAASWRLSRGHFWRIFVTFVFAMIPLLFAILLVTYAVTAFIGQADTPLGVVDTLMWFEIVANAVTRPLAAALGAAVLAWNYSLARSMLAERQSERGPY